MRSRIEAAALHATLREAQTLTEDYEQALVHLMAHAPTAGDSDTPAAFNDYLRFRQSSLGALLDYVRSYLNAVRNCVATASGQGLYFDYVAASGGLLNAKFYDYAVHDYAYMAHEPSVYALITASQRLYVRLSQKIGRLAV